MHMTPRPETTICEITQRVAPCGNRTRYPLRGSHRTNRAVANIDALRRALDDVYYESTYRRINCLESSMNALITALQASNSNSHILVFANTLPEDSEKVDIVKELCQKKQTR
ncbi:hypothetical protein SFRURICE_010162, partial [Spodoptera frugiperda]